MKEEEEEKQKEEEEKVPTDDELEVHKAFGAQRARETND